MDAARSTVARTNRAPRMLGSSGSASHNAATSDMLRSPASAGQPAQRASSQEGRHSGATLPNAAARAFGPSAGSKRRRPEDEAAAGVLTAPAVGQQKRNREVAPRPAAAPSSAHASRIVRGGVAASPTLAHASSFVAPNPGGITDAHESAHGDASGTAAKTLPVIVSIDGSAWTRAHLDMEMDRTAVLEYLCESPMFSPALERLVLPRVHVCVGTTRQLAAPTQIEMEAAKELDGLLTIRHVVGDTRNDAAAMFVLLRPQLHAPTRVAPASQPTVAMRIRAAVSSSATLDDVLATASHVAFHALRDIGTTVEQQMSAWGVTLDILQKPIPYDSTSHPPSVMLELMDPADCGPGAEPLYSRLWQKIVQIMDAPPQRRSMILLTGTSGAGKTKAAFDIGRYHAIMVVSRIFEAGMLTRPWRLLESVLEHLQRQVREHPESRYSCSLTAVAIMLLLLSCQLEWVLAVHAAAHDTCTRSGSPAHAFTLRAVVLRAQRNGIGQQAVGELFSLRLRELLDWPSYVDDVGCVKIPLEAALSRFKELNIHLLKEPVVWCHDEVQVLLEPVAFSELFSGLPTMSGLATSAANVTDTVDDSFPAFGASSSASSLPARRGWFHGLLYAIRSMIVAYAWGHLLCGTSLRLTLAMLNRHSPAQGACISADADVHLNAFTIRAWLQSYLTCEAVRGLDEALISKLAGRPLFASFFFQSLCGMLKQRAASIAAADVVRAALREAVQQASADATTRVRALWQSTYVDAQGRQPHAFVAWLYFLHRVGYGTATAIKPPHASPDVIDAIARGVLHLPSGAAMLDLASEPITAEAIIKVGDELTAYSGDDAPDSVTLALARNASGAFLQSSSKGAVAEDVVAWLLLRRARGGRVPLRYLLEPFLDEHAHFPPSLENHCVYLTGGVPCMERLGNTSSSRTFLDLLTQPGGETVLLHHTQITASGADLVLLAERPGPTDEEPPRHRLVLIQIKNSSTASMADMLDSVNLGSWYKDGPRGESASHRALRTLLAQKPDWCDPVRILVSARPRASSTRAVAAWINYGKAVHQPIVLAHLSYQRLGVVIDGGATLGALRPAPYWRWWPTPVRHWPHSSAHLQAALPTPPDKDAPLIVPSVRVRFTSHNGATLECLRKAATTAGVFAVIEHGRRVLVVQYDELQQAMQAVHDSDDANDRRAGGAFASAAFVTP